MGDVLGDPDRRRKTDRVRESDDSARPFPAQLRRLRVQRGLSLADLARETHYSKGYLSKIETGAKRVTVDVARRCDDVLGAGGELLRMARETEAPEGDAADAVVARPRPEDECPYRGLPAYTAREARWFFGRERATAELVERVFGRIGAGPVVLVAPSGAGKSSLLNAGLVPALRSGGFPMPGTDSWPVVGFTPTTHRWRSCSAAPARCWAPISTSPHRSCGSVRTPCSKRSTGCRRRARPPPRTCGRRRCARCCWSTSSRSCSPSAPTRTSGVRSYGCCARSPSRVRRARRTPRPSWCSEYGPTSPATAWSCRSWPRSSPAGCSSCSRCRPRSCASRSPARPGSRASPSNRDWFPCCCGTWDCATTCRAGRRPRVHCPWSPTP
ncbi:helix-turn-helix domain-containing protein [Streptomyces sp. PCS3-D2]|nr:helix-turn-helix domain-containing protein [Streptomyces sp. PCS3-D2]